VNTNNHFRKFSLSQDQALGLGDKVKLLQLEYYYRDAVCSNGATDDEKPESAAVGVPGLACYAEGQLFPNSAVKVFHDCSVTSSSTRSTLQNAFSIILVIFSLLVIK
jgi:hypothetical protein